MTGSLPGAAVRLSRRDSRLVVPEGMLIDELVRPRLSRQLDRAPAHVTGVMAEVGELEPGGSYRVHAEWKVLEPASVAFESATRTARGAVLLRADVPYRVHDGTVEVLDGTLLVDPGAPAHDPWRPPGPLLPASATGRSPFPCRPVVLFVGCERDESRSEWARKLVNGLIRRDVEGRLAVPEVPDGLHLTRPCEPSEESVRTLRPDVVVALDATAAGRAPEWCSSDRAAFVVEYDPGAADAVRLVAWQIGRASGRLRARIGQQIAPAAMVGLVHRLCAGPQPIPPADTDGEAVPSPAKRRPPSARTCVVVAGALDRSSSARAQGLVDHLPATGIATDLATFRRRRVQEHAYTADLVLLVGAHDPDVVAELVRSRRSASLPTVVDVGPGELREEASGMDTVALAPGAARLATGGGLASASSEAVHAALRSLGVRSHLLPTVLTRVHAAALADVRKSRASVPPDPIVGWHLDQSGVSRPAYVGAVAQGLAKVLADRADARVEIASDGAHVPKALQGFDRVTIIDPDPPPHVLARWAVQVAAPALVEGLVVGDLRHVTEASIAAVPTVLPAGSVHAIGGHVAPDMTVVHVKDPEEWAAPVRALLEDERLRTQRGAEAARRSRTVDGAPAAAAAVRRLFGWARLHPVP